MLVNASMKLSSKNLLEARAIVFHFLLSRSQYPLHSLDK